MPSELSGGMKKRVALARSIIYDTTNNAIEPEVYTIVLEYDLFYPILFVSLCSLYVACSNW